VTRAHEGDAGEREREEGRRRKEDCARRPKAAEGRKARIMAVMRRASLTVLTPNTKTARTARAPHAPPMRRSTAFVSFFKSSGCRTTGSSQYWWPSAPLCCCLTKGHLRGR